MTAYEKTDKFLRGLGFIPDPLRGGEYRKFGSAISFMLRGRENCELSLRSGGAPRAAWIILPALKTWKFVTAGIKAAIKREEAAFARQKRLMRKTEKSLRAMLNAVEKLDKDYRAAQNLQEQTPLPPGVHGTS